VSDPKLPQGSNPLAKTIGKKMRLVRLGRKVGVIKAARQLGLATTHYQMIEAGRIVPGPNLSKRLYNWAILGVTYDDVPVSKSAVADEETGPSVAVRLSSEFLTKLKRESDRLGMTDRGLATLLVEQGLQNKPSLVTLREAVDAVNRAQAKEALRIPELRDIIASDLAVAIQVGEKLTPSKKHEATLAPVQRLDIMDALREVEPMED
jgi:transcriptional regulator with XRE-family HTH domain